ncbi:MAG TPA: sugar ABC transporter substrate-binding protein [Chloroflexia bacterium]|nr:sugar ABC transporter substrate-binding protein [Chloroflexia bacterium]
MKQRTRLAARPIATVLMLMGCLLAACGDAAPNTAVPQAANTAVPATAASADVATSTTVPAAATQAPTAATTSNFQGTLQYWVLGYNPENATGKLTQAAVAAYKKAHPGVEVEITGYTGDQAGFTKLTQAVSSGQGVDVFRLPSDILPKLAQDGFVAPIDDYLSAEDIADIYPNILAGVRTNGKAYAWPLWVPPVGMYLNLDLFKERNVTPPTGDWTYEQFVEIAQKLTFTRDDGTKVYGYSGVIDPGIVNTWPFIFGDGGRPLADDNKTYTFDSPGAISGLQKLVDLSQKYHVTPPDFGSQTPADMMTGFKDKKVLAMYSEPSGSSATYRGAGMNFDVIPMPIGSSGKHVTTGGVGLISVAQQSDKTRVAAGMDLARYLTGKQVASDVKGYYLAPAARKSVTVLDPIDKFVPMVDYTILTPIIAQWPEIRTLIHPNIQNAVFGKLTPAEALKKPAAEVNTLLSK